MRKDSLRGGVTIVIACVASTSIFFASCATKPAAKVEPATATARPAPVVAPTPIVPDLPAVSAAPLVAPPAGQVLVIGLPEPEYAMNMATPDLGVPVRAAPSADGMVASADLTEPTFPSALPSPDIATVQIPGAAVPAPVAKPTPAAAPMTSVAPAAPLPKKPKPQEPPKKPAPLRAPAAPVVVASSGASPTPPPVVETVPSTPPSLVQTVDTSVPAAPKPMRTFQVEVGGQASIPFMGTGWIYLGERDGKDGVLYDSRRFEGAGALFTLVGSKTGEYNLRFLRQDLASGTSAEEVVHLSVLPAGSLIPSAATQAASQAPVVVSGNIAATAVAPVAAPPAGAMATGQTILPNAQPAAAQQPSQTTPIQSAPAAAASQAISPTAISPMATSPTATSPTATSPTATSPTATSPTATSPTATSPPAIVAGQAAAPAGQAAGGQATGGQAPTAGQTTTAGQVPGAPASAEAPAPGTPDAFLATARAEYAAGRAPTTIAAAQSYLNLAPDGSGADEALWLEAQALELDSPSRDIAEALSLYRKLTVDWPRSAFWSRANDRADYIQRYYFDIR